MSRQKRYTTEHGIGVCWGLAVFFTSNEFFTLKPSKWLAKVTHLFGVTVGATRTDFGAAAQRVPSSVRPFVFFDLSLIGFPSGIPVAEYPVRVANGPPEFAVPRH